MILLSNSRVSQIIEEGEGAHSIGHFAKCLNYHRDEQSDINDEEYGDD